MHTHRFEKNKAPLDNRHQTPDQKIDVGMNAESIPRTICQALLK